MIKLFANWLYRITHREELALVASDLRAKARFNTSNFRQQCKGAVSVLETLNLVDKGKP